MRHLASIIDTLKVLLFSESGIDAIKRLKINSFILFFLAVFIQSFPTTYLTLTSYALDFSINFIIISIVLAVTIGLIYSVMRMLGSKADAGGFFGHVSIVVFLVSIASVVFAFLLINFGILIGFPDVAFKLIQGSVIVYYLFSVFAWSSEKLAGFDEPRGVIGGLASLTLIYIFHLVLVLLP